MSDPVWPIERLTNAFAEIAHLRMQLRASEGRQATALNIANGMQHTDTCDLIKMLPEIYPCSCGLTSLVGVLTATSETAGSVLKSAKEFIQAVQDAEDYEGNNYKQLESLGINRTLALEELTESVRAYCVWEEGTDA